jgi:hypothetical protein
MQDAKASQGDACLTEQNARDFVGGRPPACQFEVTGNPAFRVAIKSFYFSTTTFEKR